MKTSLRNPEEYAKFFSRQYSLFQTVSITRRGAEVFKEYGVSAPLRIEGREGWANFIQSTEGTKRFYEVLLARVKTDSHYLPQIFARLDETGEALVARAKEVAETCGGSGEDLAHGLRDFYAAWDAHTNSVWITFFIGEVGSLLFEELLATLPEDMQSEALIRYSVPSKRAHILNISEYFHTERDESARVGFLKQKYPWLFTTDLFSPATLPSQYLEYVRTFKEKEEHHFAGPELFSPELIPLVKTYQDILYLKDKRDEYRRRGFFAIQPVVEKFEKDIQVSRGDLWLTRSEEVIRWVTDRANFEQEIARRHVGYILEADTEEEIFIVGQEARDAFLEKRDSREIHEVKGVPGSRGIVTGVAQVVRSSEECRTFEEGKILVATTTNPDYISAMQKAIAFVTDEGGITCHAAIVAREMKKPCIVGCRVATQVIQTGDHIEVDAERGIVRKL